MNDRLKCIEFHLKTKKTHDDLMIHGNQNTIDPTLYYDIIVFNGIGNDDC